MLFYPEAQKNKKRYLDAILKDRLIEDVVRQNIPDPFCLKHISRTWEPGGGATLFCIETRHKKYFLKAKHALVYVESRLESETDFIRKSSLKNEYEFLSTLQTSWVPRVIFYVEQSGFCFLALEWMEPFLQTANNMDAHLLLQCWNRLNEIVNYLYEKGIVHTDIHEFNIRFRDSELVLCDFEEARYLQQEVPFEDSLDVAGKNRYGDVGQFPAETDKGIAGYTCLSRMRQVFKTLIAEKFPAFLANCKFDDNCPFNLDAMQEPDDRIYQSLDFAGLSIAGQRPQKDVRVLLFAYLLCRTAMHKGRVRHLDIGSNVGIFCLKAASCDFVDASVGVEAFVPYVQAARILKFLFEFKKATFCEFMCGKDDLDSVGPPFHFITMLSVYHHIPAKDAFLSDFKKNRSLFLLAEFATQDRYYPERGGAEQEIVHLQKALAYPYCYRLFNSHDYHRPLILYAEVPLTAVDKFIIKRMIPKHNPLLYLLAALFEKTVSRWIKAPGATSPGMVMS
jgi:tRNA A-37 threonylcarbamoyl transferase component Bud32